MNTRLEPLPGVPPSLLGESPVWHPDEGALWWSDIPGKALHRWHEASGEHRSWPLPCEAGCIAPLADGRWLLAMRDGLWVFNPESAERELRAPPPYDPTKERFNDGRADALGRLWVGTIYEPRDAPRAALYRFDSRGLVRMAGDITVSNGLAFSPDGQRMSWADTKAHRLMAFEFDVNAGSVVGPHEWQRFAPRAPEAPLAGYGGRPDGACMDSVGCLWVAMFEGQRLVRFGPDGVMMDELPLPVRCPTMPTFGGADLRTLFITTSRENRPADELAAQPLAGCVLRLRVEVPGLPANFARLP